MLTYKHKNARLYCGDANELLTIERIYQPISLLLTDPPYGVDLQSTLRKIKFDKMANDTNRILVKEIIDKAWKLLGRHRHGYIFGGIVPSASNLTFGSQTILIWRKGIGGMGSTLPWRKDYEKIWFGCKAIESTGGRTSARIRRGSIISVDAVSGKLKEHPTQKPIALLTQLIEMSTNQGEWVLDPFMGSGSTCVAAVLEGRRSIGIEINETYFKAAVRRVIEALELRQKIDRIDNKGRGKQGYRIETRIK